MDYLREIEGKSVHDCFTMKDSRRHVWVPGPVIVGAGPSGLATAALLKEKGIPSLILERANCIASLWQFKSYDRLCLHLPKQFCELPLMPFPAKFPPYPTRNQFISYLEDYKAKFDLEPKFNETVKSAEYDESVGFWRVCTSGLKDVDETEYMCRWLIVASGENADPVTPKFNGLNEFSGLVLHSADYKRGEEFREKKVLVVGCGNSGMEVSLDLANYNALPTLVVRDTLHVLPREMLGRSTFGLSMWLLKWFPIRLVDRFVLLLARATIGDTAEIGLPRPSLGPFQLKNATGKTPVLDVGTLAKIRAGHIKVCPELKRFNRHGAEFADGTVQEFDSVIFATGYRSNVPSWLKETRMFSEKDGFPRKPFPNGWKGECGLYAVGFGKKGLLGVSFDSTKISEDIECCWKAEAKHNLTTDYFRYPLQSYQNWVQERDRLWICCRS